MAEPGWKNIYRNRKWLNRKMNIPFLSLEYTNAFMRKEMLQAFEKVYDGNWFILGKEVEGFEKAYAGFNHVKYCVGVSNGLDALTLALRALLIGNGDQVIVPSNTYIATALAVSETGATPVFAEPDPETYNLSPQSLANVISSNVKAIIPVHLFGQCCDMKNIMAIAEKNKIAVVEDNAQSHGASFEHQPAGSFGIINATSFYPGKNMGAYGDAGAITTNDNELAEKIRLLRNYGSPKKYYNDCIGYNKRLDEIQAAFLLIKLKYLDQLTAMRQQVAAWYDAYLNDIAELVLPLTAEGATHVYHIYCIRTKKRNALQEFLKMKGVETLIHYPFPPHLQKAYSKLGYQPGDFPVAELLAETSLSLPMYPGLREEDVKYIAQQIRIFFT